MDEKEYWSKAIQGDLLSRWPKDSEGQLEEPKWLCTCKDVDFNYQLRVNMLEAFGIPCLTVYPGDGSFGKLILGLSGQGVEIYVPSSLLEDAVGLCQSQPEENED